MIVQCRLSRSLQTRALPTDIQPDPYTVPTCAAWISAASGWANKAGAGVAVYPPAVLDCLPQLCSIHRRPLINRLVCDDRFSEICNTVIRTSYTLTIHQYRSFSPCSTSIFGHCINQTNATSGFDPVTFFKMSLRYNQWSKSNKNLQNWYWPPHIYHRYKIEQNKKNKW